ncbi:MAG: single-stranded DNA-binding protein [Candidatus Omnitrophota bacterium]
MSKDLNSCSFIGRLGNDPESRFMPNGTQVASFAIAVGDDYKDKSGAKIEQTEWVNLVCFGKTAEIAEKYLKKGSKIYAEGKLVTRKWDKDGITHYKTEIVLNGFQMLDSAQTNEQQKPQSQHHQQKSNGYAPKDNFYEYDDSLPF